MLPVTIIYFFEINRIVKEMTEGQPEPVGAITVGMVMLAVLVSLIFDICIILTGQFLAHYKRHKFCFYLALLESVNIPFGTIIGISTILVLRRDSVKALFSTSKEESGSS